MNTKIAHILTLLFCIVSVQAQLLVDEIKVLETHTGTIEGTLLCPYSTDKIPVVLLIAGSGPTDRDGNIASMKNNSLKLLAEGLEDHHIASLRFDKRGIGKSSSAGLQESELRFDHYISDVIGWIKLLREDPRFSSIIVAGHSEGSLIGMIAAQQTSVDKYISIAGAGYPAADIIREQLKSQPQTILDQALPILKQLENGDLVDHTPAMLNALFRKSVQPYMISWFKYKPQEEIAQLNCPTLIIQGTSDIQVSTDHAEALKKAKPEAQLIIINGMNHILKKAPKERAQNMATYSQPLLELHPEITNTIVKFISVP